MNSKSNETFDSHRLLFNLSDKINLNKSDKYVPLPKYSICYTWENIKQSYKNNKFKISAATWKEEFELPDRSHSYQIFKITLNILKSMEKRLVILQ